MWRWRLAPTDLARSRLVLAPVSPRRRWAGAGAALLAASAAGAATSHAWWHHHTGAWQPQAAPLNSTASDPRPLEHDLTTTRLQLRVAQARSQELERQIDTLNQRLHACQEEVTFFRKAVNGKR